MPIIYVSNSTSNGFATGSNSNTYAQSHSKSTPVLTINQAQILAVAGDDIRINAGTYIENTTSNQLQLNRAFASNVTFESDSGVASDVIIQGTASVSTDVKILNSASNYTFSNVTFGNRTAIAANTISAGGTSLSHFHFTNCIFLVMGLEAFHCSFGTSPFSATDITFDNCTVSAIPGQTCRGGIFVNTTVTGNTIDGVAIRNCSIITNDATTTGDDGINVISTNAIITGNQVIMASTSSAYHAIMLGVDNTVSVGACSGVIANNYISTTNAHGLFPACGCTGTISSPSVLCYNNIIVGGLHGIVGKGASGVLYTNNIHIAGPNSIDNTVLKAVTQSGQYGSLCIGFNGASNLKSFSGTKDAITTTLKALGLDIRGNVFSAVGNTSQVEYLDSESGATNTPIGTTVIDYNYYFRNGAANYIILGNTEATLALTVSTGWAGYATTGNDSHSIEAVTRTPAWNAKTVGTPGVAAYFVCTSASGYWNSQTQAYEVYNASNWYAYALPMWEATPGYYVNMLPIAAGNTTPIFYKRTSLTAAPAPSDAINTLSRTLTSSRTLTASHTLTTTRTISNLPVTID